MIPSAFRKLDKDDQAELHAIFTVEHEIEGYFDSEKSKRYEAETAKTKGGIK